MLVRRVISNKFRSTDCMNSTVWACATTFTVTFLLRMTKMTKNVKSDITAHALTYMHVCMLLPPISSYDCVFNECTKEKLNRSVVEGVRLHSSIILCT